MTDNEDNTADNEAGASGLPNAWISYRIASAVDSARNSAIASDDLMPELPGAAEIAEHRWGNRSSDRFKEPEEELVLPDFDDEECESPKAEESNNPSENASNPEFTLSEPDVAADTDTESSTEPGEVSLDPTVQEEVSEQVGSVFEAALPELNDDIQENDLSAETIQDEPVHDQRVVDSNEDHPQSSVAESTDVVTEDEKNSTPVNPFSRLYSAFRQSGDSAEKASEQSQSSDVEQDSVRAAVDEDAPADTSIPPVQRPAASILPRRSSDRPASDPATLASSGYVYVPRIRPSGSGAGVSKSSGETLEEGSSETLRPVGENGESIKLSVPRRRRASKKNVPILNFVSGNLAATMAFFVMSGLMAWWITVLFSTYIISGSSMEPTFNNGDTVVLRESKSYTQKDIIFFNEPQVWANNNTEHDDRGRLFVKRILAAPGQTVTYRNRTFYAEGNPISMLPSQYECEADKSGEATYQLKSNELFVGGDNTLHSLDSRYVFCAGGSLKAAVVTQAEVVSHGKVLFRF